MRLEKVDGTRKTTYNKNIPEGSIPGEVFPRGSLRLISIRDDNLVVIIINREKNKMKKLFFQVLPLVVALFLFSLDGFAAEVISDAGLDGVTGQTGIVFDAFLTDLVGTDYNELNAEERSRVRQKIRNTFGFLTEDEIDRIIDTQQMLSQKIAQLSPEKQKQIEEARRVLNEELGSSSEKELLKLINNEEITAENLAMVASDQLNKILIAQEIISSMFQTISPLEQNRLTSVEELINQHFDTLRQP